MLAIIEDREPDTERIDNYFASQIKPKTFYGRRNEELLYEKSFEQNCILLAQYSNESVKDSTTKEYFALIDYYNKMAREQPRNKK